MQLMKPMCFALGVALAIASHGALAQAYPTKPVRLLVARRD